MYVIIDSGIVIVCIFLILTGVKTAADWLIDHVWLLATVGLAKCFISFL